MHDEERLNSANGVGGWLLTWVILKYCGAVFGFVRIAALDIWRPGYALHLGKNAETALLIPSFVGMLVGVSAATSVLRPGKWSFPLIGFDLLYTFAWLGLGIYDVGLDHPGLLLRYAIELAVLYLWFRYFCTSRRVRATLGRNLFQHPIVITP